ncbi:MAG: hypothetical protein ABSF52_03435 [Syntrophobacteraceae bacterium]|jgi:predicted nucleic acid-binding protein
MIYFDSSALVKKYIEEKGSDKVNAHLSTALWLKQTMNEDVVFVASDLELLKAAKSEKLRILNPRI